MGYWANSSFEKLGYAQRWSRGIEFLPSIPFEKQLFHDPDLVFLRNTIVPQNLKDKLIVGRVERQG